MEILPQLVVNSIIAGSIYALIALGFNLIFNVAKFYNIAHGGMAVIGGYGVYFFYIQLDLNLYLAIISSVIIAGLVGLTLDKIVFLPLRKRKATTAVQLIASLGLFTMVQAIVAMLFTSQFHSLNNGELQKIYSIGTAVFTQTQLIMFVSGIILLLAIALFLKFTLTGKAIKAVSDDEEVAKIVGINTNQIIAIVFFIGSAIAGLAGLLVGFDTGIEPTMGLMLLLGGITAVIIGGAGNIYGGYLGAFILGFAENFGIWKISGEWKIAIAFSLLIIFLIFKPQGLFKK